VEVLLIGIGGKEGRGGGEAPMQVKTHVHSLRTGAGDTGVCAGTWTHTDTHTHTHPHTHTHAHLLGEVVVRHHVPVRVVHVQAHVGLADLEGAVQRVRQDAHARAVGVALQGPARVCVCFVGRARGQGARGGGQGKGG
jgi:hypothetical protein